MNNKVSEESRLALKRDVDVIAGNVAKMIGDYSTLENLQLMTWLYAGADLKTATFCHGRIWALRTDEPVFENVRVMGVVTPTAWFHDFQITRKEDRWYFEYLENNDIPIESFSDLPEGLDWATFEQGAIA